MEGALADRRVVGAGPAREDGDAAAAAAAAANAAAVNAAAANAANIVPSLEQPPAKAMRTSGEATAASMRHIQTEKRRRDRINDGYTALRELIPSKDKADKATILMQVVEYIRQIQGVMTQVLAHAPNGQLPEELQWSLRMLLPREGAGPGFTTAAQAAATHPGTGAASGGSSGGQPGGNGASSGGVASGPGVSQAAAGGVVSQGGAYVGQGQPAQGYTPQQVAMLQQGMSEGYIPASAGLALGDVNNNVNQLQAFLSQAQHSAMGQSQVVQLLQLQAMLQAQANGQAGGQEALRQYMQQQQALQLQQQAQVQGQVLGTPAPTQAAPPASPGPNPTPDPTSTPLPEPQTAS